MIRCGTDGDFNHRNVDGEVYCSTDPFGDPTPGQVKLCEANTVPPGRAATRQPEPNEIPPREETHWQSCAREGQPCDFRGGAHVRYGANGVYRVVYAANSLRCNTDAFSGDPARGIPKRCEIYWP